MTHGTRKLLPPFCLDREPRTAISGAMNEKTAKLLNRYSLAKGANPKELKREWLSLNARERFQKRQALLQALKSGK